MKKFTQQLSGNEKALGFLVCLPLFFYLSTIISSALVKFMFLQLFPGSYTELFLNMVLNVMNDIIMLIILAIVFRGFYKRNREKFTKETFFKGVGSIVFIYLALVIGNLITMILTGSSDTTSVNQSAIDAMVKQYGVLMFFTISIGAPIVEETLFRGLIFTTLRKYNRILAYIVSAFLFGFIHVMYSVFGGNIGEIVQIFPYMMCGFIFAYVYESTDNIYASMLTHCLQNTVSLIMMLFM